MPSASPHLVSRRSAAALALGLLAVAPAARGASVAVVLNPDPVEPGETLEIQVTVVNDDGFARSDVTVSLVLPAGLATLDETTMTDGAACTANVSNNGACDPLETVSWTIDALPAGTGRTFRLPPLVAPATAPGTVISVEAEVFDDAAEIATDTRSATVVANRILDLELVESADPVGAGATLSYAVHYGHPQTSSLAPSAQLALELPAGATFVSATGGGVHAGGTVTWALGTLAPGQAGVERVTVTAPGGVADGALLAARATIVDSTPANQSRARAVTRVRNGEPLRFALVAGPDPVRLGEAQEVELAVANAGALPILDVFVELVVPEEVDDFAEEVASGAPVCIAGVTNNGACDARERLVWELGTIAAGNGRTLRLPPRIAAGLVDGSTLRWRAVAEGLAGGVLESVEADAAAIVQAEPALELALVESADPVGPGETIAYALSFGHTATSSLAPGAQLELVLPPGVTFAAASDGGVHAGGTVTWTLGTLQPGQGGVRHATATVAGGAAEASLLGARARIVDTASPKHEARADALARVRADTPLVLGLAANPDPVAPEASQDVELVVTNRGDFPLFDTTVELVVPEEIADFAEEIASGDPTCVAGVTNNGACDARERLVWSLGELAPGNGRTLRLPPVVAAGLADGTLIGWRAAAEGSDGGVLEHVEAGAATIVRDEPPLDLVLLESAEPVAPGGSLTYAVGFGHLATASLAPDARIELTLPPGTTFSGAEDGGVHAGGVVTWTLGALQPGQGGVRRATVSVPGGTGEAALLAARARIVDASAPPKESRARALTRVRSDVPLALAIVASPDPVAAGETQGLELVASNRGVFPIFDAVVELSVAPESADFAEEIASGAPVCIAGVSNNGACDARERLVWELGEVAAGTGRTLRLSPRLAGGLAEGTQVAWRASARGLDGALLESAEAGAAAIVEEGRRFDLALTPTADPVAPGGDLTYQIRFGNRGATPLLPGTRLELTLPPGIGGPTPAGGLWTWVLPELAPGASVARPLYVGTAGGLAEGELLTARARVRDPSAPADQARAAAVTRIRTQPPVTLSVALPAGPLEPGDDVSTRLRVTNTTGFPVFDVVVEAIVPEGVASFPPSQTDGGTCIAGVSNNGACDAGERIVWTIASIPAGGSVELDLLFTLATGGSALVDGEVLALQAFVEGGGEQASQLAAKTIPEPGAALGALAALAALGALAGRRSRRARG